MKDVTKEILVYILRLLFSIFYVVIFIFLMDVPWFKKFIVFLVNLFPNRTIGGAIIAGVVGIPAGLILRAIGKKILWKRF